MNSLYLTWQYLKDRRIKTSVLVGATTMLLLLPIGMTALSRHLEARLRDRASSVPLLVGPQGSPLDLTLGLLYFRQAARTTSSNITSTTTSLAEIESRLETTDVESIPIFVRFRVRQFPIVGTNLDYLRFRALNIRQGRPFGMLGECVIGAGVARQLRLSVGDSVISSPESFVDLAGAYPLKMPVVGILRPTGGPEDEAILVDLRTAWIIAGLGHGHQDAQTLDESRTLRRDEAEVVANAAVGQFNEITAENVGSFHFHGDTATYPISGCLINSRSDQPIAMLRGRLQREGEVLQGVVPLNAINELIDSLLKVRRFIFLVYGFVVISALLLFGLVTTLSWQLRRAEFATIQKIGCSRGTILAMAFHEVWLVLLTSAALAALAAEALKPFSRELLFWIVST